MRKINYKKKEKVKHEKEGRREGGKEGKNLAIVTTYPLLGRPFEESEGLRVYSIMSG